MLETSFSRAYEALSHDRNAPVSGINKIVCDLGVRAFKFVI